MFYSEYTFDTLQTTYGAKVRYPCLEDKLEHAVYKFCVSLYSCLFSLISIGDKSKSGPVNMGILLIWIGILQLW